MSQLTFTGEANIQSYSNVLQMMISKKYRRFKDCVKIVQDLNFTLEQVLRVSHEEIGKLDYCIKRQ